MKCVFSAAGTVENRVFSNWAAQRIEGCERGWRDECVTMRVYHGDELRAVVVFHDYRPETGAIEISGAAASRKWLTRGVLAAVHDYAFNDAECRIAVMRVSERSSHIRRGAKAFGYTETVIPRLRGRDEAECILTLTDEEWERSRFHAR